MKPSRIKLYQFAIPTNTNEGLSYELSRKAFENTALREAGGYTQLSGFAQGVWLSVGPPERAIKGQLALYHVAALPEVADKLVEAFWPLFPDQQALFIAELGPAYVHNRPAALQAAE